MGGAWFKELFGEEDSVNPEDLITVAMDALWEQLNISERPKRVISKVHKVSLRGPNGWSLKYIRLVWKAQTGDL